MPSFRACGFAALALALGACTSMQQSPPPGHAARQAPANAAVQRMYGAMVDGGWRIPPADPARMEPENLRRLVEDPTGEPPGTVVVDTRGRFLYLVMEGGKAMRYRVGVGKAGLEFEGRGVIARKAAWPRWTPTRDMIRREPEKYGDLEGGMEGGIDNPLGARALYLHKNGRDTLYRIHGTNQAWSIGKAVSSGCIRMLNQDVIDLASRVPAGSRVVVRQ